MSVGGIGKCSTRRRRRQRKLVRRWARPRLLADAMTRISDIIFKATRPMVFAHTQAPGGFPGGDGLPLALIYYLDIVYGEITREEDARKRHRERVAKLRTAREEGS